MAFVPQQPLQNPEVRDLKQRTIRGAAASGAAQAAALVLRTGSMMVIARLVLPRDFGLFGMVVAFTGALSLFRDLGLSLASVTRSSVTNDQLSTLFWVNVAVGIVLAAACATAAPVLVSFYAEPALFHITVAVGVGFVFMGAGAQHRAILQRGMRFGALAVIDTAALLIGILAGIGTALLGWGYWALVVLTLFPQIASTAGVWLATSWLPGRPRHDAGVGHMLRFGGSVTANALIVYVAYNLDKVLVGRVWGPAALGIYGRAYQLINLPTDSLTSTVSQVAFPALSRLKNDPVRLRSYFLQAYGLFVSLALPVTVACGLFAEDVIGIFLGVRWLEAAPVFRRLVPVTLVVTLFAPVGWVLFATDRVVRSLKMAAVIAPAVVAGYGLGLREGPAGAALGFSVAMAMLLPLLIAWACHGTPISARDLVGAVRPPATAALAGAATVAAASRYLAAIDWMWLRLVAETGVLFGTYWLVLLFGFNRRSVYLNVLSELGMWRARDTATTRFPA